MEEVYSIKKAKTNGPRCFGFLSEENSGENSNTKISESFTVSFLKKMWKNGKSMVFY